MDLDLWTLVTDLLILWVAFGCSLHVLSFLCRDHKEEAFLRYVEFIITTRLDLTKTRISRVGLECTALSGYDYSMPASDV